MPALYHLAFCVCCSLYDWLLNHADLGYQGVAEEDQAWSLMMQLWEEQQKQRGQEQQDQLLETSKELPLLPDNDLPLQYKQYERIIAAPPLSPHDRSDDSS